MSSLLSEDDKLRFARMLADEFRPSGSRSRAPRRQPTAPRAPPPAPRPPVYQQATPTRPPQSRPVAAPAVVRPPNLVHRDRASANFLNNTQPPPRAALSTAVANTQVSPALSAQKTIGTVIQKQQAIQVHRVAQVHPASQVQPFAVAQVPAIQGRATIKADAAPAQTPNAPINGDDILQQLIRAVPSLSGTFNTQNSNSNIDDGSDSDSDMDIESEPISLLERAGIIFPVI